MKYITLLFVFICSLAYAGEYIQYDKDGIIIRKWYSVDESMVKDETNILQVNRETFKALNRFDYVKDRKLTKKAQSEIDAILAQEEQEKIDATNAQKTLVDGIKAKLKLQGFTDEEITYLISSGI